MHRLTSASETVDFQHVVVGSAADPAFTADSSSDSNSSCALVVWPPPPVPSAAVLPGEADTLRAFRVHVVSRSVCSSSQPLSPTQPRTSFSASPPALADNHAGMQPAQNPTDQHALHMEGLTSDSVPVGDASGHAAQPAPPRGLPPASAAAAATADPPSANAARGQQTEQHSALQQQDPSGERRLDSNQPAILEQSASAVSSDASSFRRSAQHVEPGGLSASALQAGARVPGASDPQQHDSSAAVMQPAQQAMRPAIEKVTGAISSTQALLQESWPLVPLLPGATSAVNESSGSLPKQECPQVLAGRPSTVPSSQQAEDGARPLDPQLSGPPATRSLPAATSDSAHAGDNFAVQVSP